MRTRLLCPWWISSRETADRRVVRSRAERCPAAVYPQAVYQIPLQTPGIVVPHDRARLRRAECGVWNVSSGADPDQPPKPRGERGGWIIGSR